MMRLKHPQLWHNCIGAWKTYTGGVETLYDSSVRNTSTVHSGSTPTKGVLGGVQTAQFAGGSNNYYMTNLYPSLGDFTVTAWVFPTTTNANYMRIVDQKHSAGFWLGHDGSGTASNWGGGVISTPYVFCNLTQNAWNFICMNRRKDVLTVNSYDSTRTWNTATGTVSTSLTNPAYPIRIGNSTPEESPIFDQFVGGIQEVRLYDAALMENHLRLLGSRMNIAYAQEYVLPVRRSAAATFKAAWAVRKSQTIGAR